MSPAYPGGPDDKRDPTEFELLEAFRQLTATQRQLHLTNILQTTAALQVTTAKAEARLTNVVVEAWEQADQENRQQLAEHVLRSWDLRLRTGDHYTQERMVALFLQRLDPAVILSHASEEDWSKLASSLVKAIIDLVQRNGYDHREYVAKAIVAACSVEILQRVQRELALEGLKK